MIPVVLAQLDDVLAEIRTQREYDIVFLDTAGSLDARTTKAIGVSTPCLVPCRPSCLDLDATMSTVRLTHRLQKIQNFAFVVNQARAGTLRIAETNNGLVQMGVIAGEPVATRVAHQDAIASGLGVSEYQPGGAAAIEMTSLWTWISRRLDELEANHA